MSWAALCAASVLLKPIAKTITTPISMAPISELTIVELRKSGSERDCMLVVFMVFPRSSGKGLNTGIDGRQRRNENASLLNDGDSLPYMHGMPHGLQATSSNCLFSAFGEF